MAENDLEVAIAELFDRLTGVDQDRCAHELVKEVCEARALDPAERQLIDTFVQELTGVAPPSAPTMDNASLYAPPSEALAA